MSSTNQIRPSNQGPGKWYCNSCKLPFDSDSAVREHCRDPLSHLNEWDERCNWLFPSPEARENHVNNSSFHFPCYEDECKNDFPDSQARERHREEVHAYCKECDVIYEYDGLPNRLAWVRHQRDDHNMCEECGARLGDEDERMQHQKSHRDREKTCFGCRRRFTTYSAMMIHLETGTCTYGFNISDIDRWTSQCFPHSDTDAIYTCARCRERGDPASFKCLSALLQHQEGPGCPVEGYSPIIQTLMKFIAVRVRIAPYPAGQALTALTKLYVDNSGEFLEQLENIEEMLPRLQVEKKDARIRTVSCLIPKGMEPWLTSPNT